MNRTEGLMALLVDGDNARPTLLRPIIEEVAKYGKVTIRRIYGDWTSPSMSGWKKILNETSFAPIQKFAYTTGKNSTDSSLIIDAMDLLHTANIDGFCIVSSDSDYTSLARRIREQGIFVMGIGEKQTPSAFVHSCEIFTFTDTLASGQPAPAHVSFMPKKIPLRRRSKKSSRPKAKLDPSIIDKAFESANNGHGSANLSTIGEAIRRLDSAFSCRKFGHKTLTQLFTSLQAYEVFYVRHKKSKNTMVRKRGR